MGLPPGERRRSPGLRREEVAALSGVSVTWLTWLEQGRNVHPSREVLEALSRALRLSPAEHDHLLRLGGRASDALGRRSADTQRPIIRTLLDALAPAPAYAMDNEWNICAWNEPMRMLFASLPELDESDRTLLRIMFDNIEARALIGDWETEARRVVSQYRSELDGRSDTPERVALVAELSAASTEFSRWWSEHLVDEIDSHLRVFEHPVAGRLRFESALLSESGTAGVRFVVHLPVDGDDSTQRLLAACVAAVG